MLTRFIELVKTPKERRFLFKLVGAKMAGLGVVFAGIWAFTAFLGGTAAHAAVPTAQEMTNVVNATNIISSIQ